MGLSIEKVHHGNWLPSERAKREQESVSRTKTESLCNLVSEVISEIFTIFYLLEGSYKDQSTLKEREL